MNYKELIARLHDFSAFTDLDHHEIETLKAAAAAIEALEAQVNTCGSGAGCLHKDARIAALEAEVERLLVSESSLAEVNRGMHDKVTEQRKQLAVVKQAQPEQAQPERAPFEKPIAYFDFQERGFYWASNTYISLVPVAIKVEPMPLFTEAQLKQAVRDAYEDAAKLCERLWPDKDCSGHEWSDGWADGTCASADAIRALIKEVDA